MNDDPIKEDLSQPEPIETATILPDKTSDNTVLPTKKHNKTIIILSVIIGVLLIGIIVFAIIYFTPKKATVINTAVESTETLYKPADSTDPAISELEGLATPTWIKPEKIADINVFTDMEGFYGTDFTPSLAPVFYKVGSDNNRDIIIASVACIMYCNSGQGLYTFINDSADHYLLLANNSQSGFSKGAYVGPKLGSNVQIDTTSSYADTVYQKSITLNGATVTNTDNQITLFSTIEANTTATMSHYADTKFGEMLQRTFHETSGYAIQAFALNRPDGTSVSYQLRPNFIGDDGIPAVTWIADNTTPKDSFRLDGLGSCGSSNGIAVLMSGTKDLTITGKTDTGENIYEITNVNNETLKYFYDAYAYHRTGTNSAVTIEDFIKDHGLFVYKDALGRYIVFSNNAYGSGAECGKPVIYLYPETTTNVSVKVNANITKSEPTYNNGWNVIAQPDGKLTTNGKIYDSLFWEGTGGYYPTVNSGFIVAQKDLTKTIQSQLTQLGLNDKEANDFMEFWIPKMPSTPYVRLTWFGTNEMNKLAPLTVTPAPDTTIRIFLDFEGLAQKASIQTQNLSSIPRKGFSLIEWGGLLRK